MLKGEWLIGFRLTPETQVEEATEFEVSGAVSLETVDIPTSEDFLAQGQNVTPTEATREPGADNDECFNEDDFVDEDNDSPAGEFLKKEDYKSITVREVQELLAEKKGC